MPNLHLIDMACRHCDNSVRRMLASVDLEPQVAVGCRTAVVASTADEIADMLKAQGSSDQ